MAATRLVEVRHGGATTVRDFRRYAGLDLLPGCSCAAASSTPSVARSVLEARLAIGPAVAALAAARGGPALAAALTETLDRLAGTDDDVERQVHALEFWDQVVDAADSMVFRLMFNSLRAAYEPALEALAPLMAEEVGQVDAYRVLTAALGAGDPETARAAADRVLRPATESLLGALAALAAVPARWRTDHDEAQPRDRGPGRPAAGRRRGPAIIWAARRSAGSRCRCARRGAEFWKHPSPWMIAAFLLGSIVARVAVGGGSWWELVIPAALVALFPVIEWCHPRRDPALAAAHARAGHDRLPAGPRPPRPPRRPARPAAGLHPLEGAGLAAAGVRRDRLARDADAGLGALPAGVGLRDQVRLRVDPLPRAQRLPAEVALVPLGVAQPPAAPLQERALLVHGHQRRHGGPAVRHLPRRPVGGADLTDGQAAARARGVAAVR